MKGREATVTWWSLSDLICCGSYGACWVLFGLYSTLQKMVWSVWRLACSQMTLGFSAKADITEHMFTAC